MINLTKSFFSSSNSAFNPYVRPTTGNEEKNCSTTNAKVTSVIQDYLAAKQVDLGIKMIKTNINASCEIFQNCLPFLKQNRPFTAEIFKCLGNELITQGVYLNGLEMYGAAICAQDDEREKGNLRKLIEQLLKKLTLSSNSAQLDTLLKFGQRMIEKDVVAAMVILTACISNMPNKNRATMASICEELADKLCLQKRSVESWQFYVKAVELQENQHIQVNLLMKMGGLLKCSNFSEIGNEFFKMAYKLLAELIAVRLPMQSST